MCQKNSQKNQNKVLPILAIASILPCELAQHCPDVLEEAGHHSARHAQLFALWIRPARCQAPLGAVRAERVIPRTRPCARGGGTRNAEVNRPHKLEGVTT